MGVKIELQWMRKQIAETPTFLVHQVGGRKKYERGWWWTCRGPECLKAGHVEGTCSSLE